MASLGHQSLHPTDLGRVDKEMASPDRELQICNFKCCFGQLYYFKESGILFIFAIIFTAEAGRRAVLLARCIVQWTREGTHARKTGSGATRKTTRREGRRIEWQALVDPTVTRSTIPADVGVAIVPQTISRHIAEANLKSKRPFRAIPLTPEQRQLRLQWCHT
ncbi:HTH_Tnp_Tc3_2 domain-containing protein [Trichonephila clavipes]|uniref:HTH_Tnp_Tc3_2 domain-containing protein n=1 Tax=Trichonephila clavipes TaxID=2585209 RepID=A0A8X6WDU6_TRICX|nr:HTH_Tnp_Tc3_2 domain-containing protein [Trichonephila clavipes]